jgi:hypothetical protein
MGLERITGAAALATVRCLLACVLMTLLAACGTDMVQRGGDPLANASSISTLPSPVGPVDCAPPSSWELTERGKTEVRGKTSTREPFWALFATDGPIPAATSVHVAWRLGGAHSARVVLVSPEGDEIDAPGLVPDPTIRWERPGDAFRSTIQFPEPGCWRLAVSRGGRSGDLWVEVS